MFVIGLFILLTDKMRLWVYGKALIQAAQSVFRGGTSTCSRRLHSIIPRRQQQAPPPPARDANAAGVAFLRYISAFHDDIVLDPQLRTYESFFLTPMGKFNGVVVRNCRPLLNVVIEEQALFMACRTAVFDDIFLDAIRRCRV